MTELIIKIGGSLIVVPLWLVGMFEWSQTF